jgi:uncharacterized LabA/DUF88 family protein
MKLIILIDGGFLRVAARQAGQIYDGDLIERIAHDCVDRSELLLRIHYYDCVPFVGSVRQPVSGIERDFSGSDRWLQELAERDHFLVRLGSLKFRGFKPRSLPIPPRPTDDDFRPDFEQRGLDLQIGLDIASIAQQRIADRLLLISGDTGLSPALAVARTMGLQTIVAGFVGQRILPELIQAGDLVRRVDWPVL